MILEWLFTFLVVYLLYKLVFDFILPVSRATSQVRSKINEMNRQQQTYQQQQSEHIRNTSSTQKTSSQPKPSSDDYIDFEEVK